MQRGKSVLLFGARQTGKTTLLKHLNPDVSISFIQHQIRRKYEINPSLLIKEIEAEAQSRQLKRKMIVALDEFQKVPEITDEVQDLIDRNIAIFILTGSSARKLKKSKKLNLLPGRVVSLKLDPLTLAEIPKEQQSLEQLLLFGALPGIFTLQKETNKETDLDSYINTYLEE
ncbi:AAA family ATPase, partial [bacterium]|nr:AAA family ATPase [bacterium]